MQHPRLARDGLDHVIAVEALQRLEVVKRAARATGPAHVDIDHREPEQVGDRRDPAVGSLRIGVAVAGVLDQRRVGPFAAGQVHVDRELGPVAGREVAVAAGRDPLVVGLGAQRRRTVREHGQLRGLRTAFGPYAVRAAGRHVTEQQRAEGVDPLGLHRAPAAVDQTQQRAGLGAGDVDLLGAAAGRERGRRGRRGNARSGEQHDHRDQERAGGLGARKHRLSAMHARQHGRSVI